jgi:long-chain acyl-CoA synthetase
MSGALLVTGGTGLLGGQIVARYLERTDRRVYALVRAADDAEAARRIDEALAATYGADHDYGDRVTAVAGDLERPGLGLSASRLDEVAEDVTTVIHAAASVSFALPLDEARSINVAGTERVLELAAACERRGGLDRFAHVSTTYVAGAYDGHFTEEDADVGQEFRNSYERSKLEAEQLVRREAGSLPIRIFRPGIVVGEEQSGWTASFNVLYYPVKLFAKGANPPIVPARRDTPIDAVPIDYVADGIFALADREGEIGTTFHLVAGPNAGTIGELLDMSADRFGRRPPRLVPLGLYMHTLHHVLKRVYRGKRKRQILQAREFLPYFSMRQTFDNTRARELLEPDGIVAPALTGYFDQLLAYAAASEWGREPLARDEARALAADEAPPALAA